ncbi:Hypothetical protein A7982_01363 [Minicystis rosea]|nr:Hypothetical protein A7982_01363 [Minicystis rosea]
MAALPGCGGQTPATSDSSASVSSGSGSTGSGAAGGGGFGGASSSSSSSATSSGSGGSGGSGGGQSCIIQGHVAGERFPVGDNCNFCDCNADGTTTCTSRTCPDQEPGCTYNGHDYAFAERFPSTDKCNECICAASGLACTRRACSTMEEGAILVESLDTPCGPDQTFTAQAVLDGLPVNDIEVPFLYVKDGPKYPETLPDTKVRVRVVYDGGFAVCRIPSPGQEAFDIEALVEWISADGSFNEGFHTYLRRNAGGFTDAWYIGVGVQPGGLDGTYNPNCYHANGFGFAATFDADGTASGYTNKLCETDIMLDVATWTYTP